MQKYWNQLILIQFSVTGYANKIMWHNVTKSWHRVMKWDFCWQLSQFFEFWYNQSMLIYKSTLYFIQNIQEILKNYQRTTVVFLNYFWWIFLKLFITCIILTFNTTNYTLPSISFQNIVLELSHHYSLNILVWVLKEYWTMLSSDSCASDTTSNSNFKFQIRLLNLIIQEIAKSVKFRICNVKNLDC